MNRHRHAPPVFVRTATACAVVAVIAAVVSAAVVACGCKGARSVYEWDLSATVVVPTAFTAGSAGSALVPIELSVFGTHKATVSATVEFSCDDGHTFESAHMASSTAGSISGDTITGFPHRSSRI